MLYRCVYHTNLIGDLTLESDGASLTACLFERDRYAGLHNRAPWSDDPGLEPLAQARAWLDDYFAGRKPDPASLPLDPQGTLYQKRVWRELMEIPYGETTTYGAIATRLADRYGGGASARAAGGAVGRNPIGIIIPCHRVVGATGSLTGFGGGIAAKVALLEHEGVDMSRFTVPAKGTAL